MDKLQKPAKGSGKLERYTRRLARRREAERHDKAAKLAETKRLREIRFGCYLRDHRRCRAFKTPLLFETDNLLKLAHSHHKIHKSAGGSDEAHNRVTLSPKAHRMHHDGLLEMDGDPNATLTFYEYEFAGGTRKLVRTWESAV